MSLNLIPKIILVHQNLPTFQIIKENNLKSIDKNYFFDELSKN